MQNRNLIQGIILTAALASPLGLQAQTFINGDWTLCNPAVTVGADTFGTFLATAPLNSSVTFNSTESSTTNPQFLWVPALSALRVGAFSQAPSTTTMGQGSVAFGNSLASGDLSFASGNSYAISYASTALGNASNASNTGATSIGYYVEADGSGSTAMGIYSDAEGDFSVALGEGAAIGSFSVALGEGYSGGAFSFSVGQGSASGNYSVALGQATSTTSLDSVAVGAHNTGAAEPGAPTPNPTSWVLTDPLFEIGNGTSSTPSDALIVYKDGSAQFSGPVKVPQSGDIPMYTGN